MIFPTLSTPIDLPPVQPATVPSRQNTWKVKPYEPSLAMKLALERARSVQPALKSMTSDVRVVIHHER